jgi:hypothetical protein
MGDDGYQDLLVASLADTGGRPDSVTDAYTRAFARGGKESE